MRLVQKELEKIKGFIVTYREESRIRMLNLKTKLVSILQGNKTATSQVHPSFKKKEQATLRFKKK